MTWHAPDIRHFLHCVQNSICHVSNNYASEWVNSKSVNVEINRRQVLTYRQVYINMRIEYWQSYSTRCVKIVVRFVEKQLQHWVNTARTLAVQGNSDGGWDVASNWLACDNGVREANSGWAVSMTREQDNWASQKMRPEAPVVGFLPESWPRASFADNIFGCMTEPRIEDQETRSATSLWRDCEGCTRKFVVCFIIVMCLCGNA